MYQSYFLQKFRTVLRNIGLSKLIGRILAKKNYEEVFETGLLLHIKDTDIIYDIGANRGFYTKKFLTKATLGQVFAFEPVPENNQRISLLQAAYHNLSIYPIALGSDRGAYPMSIGTDNLKATSSLKTKKEDSDIVVSVETLDNIVAQNFFIPNVIKIDVEGFELEVLKGMEQTIKNGQVCVIAMEVHFELLKKMDYNNAPKLIINILERNGFKVNWVDPSHILAIRGRH